MAVNGMVILTLSVSFVLMTTQTVAQGRAALAQCDLYAAGGTGRDSLLAALASLASHLNAVPLALYYSAPRPDRRLPERLVRLVEEAVAENDPAFLRQLRIPLSDLPFFSPAPDLTDEAFVHALRQWSRGFIFHSGDMRSAGAPDLSDEQGPRA
jgi:hypothetical protein